MAIYKVWGGKVKTDNPLYIEAADSSEAIKQAREIEPEVFITQSIDENTDDYKAGFHIGYIHGCEKGFKRDYTNGTLDAMHAKQGAE